MLPEHQSWALLLAWYWDSRVPFEGLTAAVDSWSAALLAQEPGYCLLAVTVPLLPLLSPLSPSPAHAELGRVMPKAWAENGNSPSCHVATPAVPLCCPELCSHFH